MEHGTSRSFVVTHPDDIGQVKRVEFYWEYDMDVLQPRSICFFWCNDHLYVSSIGVTEAEEDGNRGKRGIQVDTKLCSQGPREYADIASRTSAVFIDKCDDQELLN
uniref:Uncharacterized protein n=3 Tax=Aphidini TaxID=33387 RepID=A0A2S2NA77_SCHGA